MNGELQEKREGQEKVSVIMASFNKAGYIKSSINSVLGQTYENFELLIVDDCSTDNTRQILSQFQKDERVKVYFLNANSGANYCRNYALTEVATKFVLFLDADDLLDRRCLENRVRQMELDPELDFSVFPMLVFKNNVGDLSYMWIPESETPLEDFLKHDLPWQTMQPIWKTDLLRKIGGFDENFQRLQDVELHTRVLLETELKYKLFKGVPDCYYRIDEERKNFNAFNFLNRWVESSVKYCNKFTPLIARKYLRLLPGTIYSAYLQVIMHYRNGNLKREEYTILREKIHQQILIKNSTFKRMLLWIAEFYNLRFPRIPGVNKALKLLITR